MKHLYWMALTLTLLLACRAGNSLSPLPPPATSQVLFQDDFSDPTSGWDRYRADDAILDYEQGVYRIALYLPKYDVWSTPGLQFTDVRIEVDVAKINGPDDNDFGVLCRYDPGGPNFYAFLISSDGYYGILKQQGEEQTLLNGPEMDISPAIATGTARNHITAICQGNRLTLMVNNVELVSVQDDAFTIGDIGLVAGTFEEAGTDIVFDNLSVLQP